MTSKPQVIARKVTDHFGLSRFFEEVYGPGLHDESKTKGDLIAEVLDGEHLSPERVAMIGDRRHDLEGARAHGVHAVGVTWGYGAREELLEAGAERLVETPEELLEVFG